MSDKHLILCTAHPLQYTEWESGIPNIPFAKPSPTPHFSSRSPRADGSDVVETKNARRKTSLSDTPLRGRRRLDALMMTPRWHLGVQEYCQPAGQSFGSAQHMKSPIYYELLWRPLQKFQIGLRGYLRTGDVGTWSRIRSAA